MSSNSETASASPEATHAGLPADDGQSGMRAEQPNEADTTHERPALAMRQCPACGSRSFISKLLVFEETTFDEDGEQLSRHLDVRAEFEFVCEECQTILRTLPVERRDYYEDVEVLAAERRAALRAQVRELCGRVVRRLWGIKSRLAFVLGVLVAVALLVF